MKLTEHAGEIWGSLRIAIKREFPAEVGEIIGEISLSPQRGIWAETILPLSGIIRWVYREGEWEVL